LGSKPDILKFHSEKKLQFYTELKNEDKEKN